MTIPLIQYHLMCVSIGQNDMLRSTYFVICVDFLNYSDAVISKALGYRETDHVERYWETALRKAIERGDIQ